MLKQFAVAALLVVAIAHPAAPAEAGLLKKVAKAVVMRTVVPVICTARKLQHKSTGSACH